MDCMSVISFAACTSDDALRAKLPFGCVDINRDSIPSALRRRSSSAMQLTFTVASEVCKRTECSPASLPTVFASVAGEIQTTDQLCIELAKADGLISPSAFHNSVQNTAAGYWSIAQQCMQPASALAAGRDTFAMALLEAWCQLSCQGGELLLVCYDEVWPDYLAPCSGRPAFASALLLAAGAVTESVAQLGKPKRQIGSEFPSEWAGLTRDMPALAAIPLLDCLANGGEARTLPLTSTAEGWQIKVCR